MSGPATTSRCDACGSTFGEILPSRSGQTLCRDCYVDGQGGAEIAEVARSLGRNDLSDRQNGASPAAEPAQLPSDAATAPPTAALLAEIKSFVTRFVALRFAEQADTLALYVLHTHAIQAAEATPYLAVESPEKGCGKTLLLEVLEMITARAWKLDGLPSEAVLFRQVDNEQPTVLLDEVDRLFNSSKDRVEPLTALLNGGNRRGASVPRLVAAGNDWRVKDFTTFSPKVLAGIDSARWPDTVRDRAIVIRLERISREETVERMRTRKIAPEAEALRTSCEAWAEAHVEKLTGAEPDDLDFISPRAFDGWEPLLAIANLAGPDWSERAVAAARKLSGATAADEDSIGVQLLSDIREVLGEQDRILTRDLLNGLTALEESPWGEWRRGEPITSRGLATLLRRYKGIRSTTLRAGEDLGKGYMAEAFQDAFSRYLPGPPTPVRNKRNNGLDKPETGGSASVTGDRVLRVENGHKPLEQANVTAVTAETAIPAVSLEDALLDPVQAEAIRASVDGEWIEEVA